MDFHSFKLGIKNSTPVCLAFLLMFGSLGILSHIMGASLLEILASTILVFAVPMQAWLLENAQESIPIVMLNAFIINFKFSLMTAALLPLFNLEQKIKIRSLHFVVSSTYILCTSAKDIKCYYSYYLGTAIIVYIIAIIATIIGYLLWNLHPDLQSFLSSVSYIVLPVHFVCLTLKRQNSIVILLTLIGFMLAPLLHLYCKSYIITLIWLSIALIFTVRGVKCTA